MSLLVFDYVYGRIETCQKSPSLIIFCGYIFEGTLLFYYDFVCQFLFLALILLQFLLCILRHFQPR